MDLKDLKDLKDLVIRWFWFAASIGIRKSRNCSFGGRFQDLLVLSSLVRISCIEANTSKCLKPLSNHDWNSGNLWLRFWVGKTYISSTHTSKSHTWMAMDLKLNESKPPRTNNATTRRITTGVTRLARFTQFTRFNRLKRSGSLGCPARHGAGSPSHKFGSGAKWAANPTFLQRWYAMMMCCEQQTSSDSSVQKVFINPIFRYLKCLCKTARGELLFSKSNPYADIFRTQSSDRSLLKKPTAPGCRTPLDQKLTIADPNCLTQTSSPSPLLPQWSQQPLGVRWV